ncbi:hypothetical protein BS47DRAFT_1396744 [Hydnum rufescens UP504]|uniref:Spindle pole body component n=1 Tax=Hydnum rufescens UP504 TaxID=1448309 RepID=A0A9P6APP7_9AGAM|nr:hypothetical protein BS47DRAFT_1396744 [Hydnum rufescens UP504]
MQASSSRTQLPRPPSARSFRPGSALSQRPGSSHSQSTARSRQPPPRLVQLTGELVSRIKGTSESSGAWAVDTDAISRSLEYGRNNAPAQDVLQIDKRIMGLAEKSRIILDDEIAEALTVCYSKLKTHVKDTSDRDSHIRTSNLPDIVQFLLALSSPPDYESKHQALKFLDKLRDPDPAESTTLTWEQILRDEPYEGQHWEGAFGLPHGSTVEGWEARSLSSSWVSDDDDPSVDGVLDDDDDGVAIRSTTPITPSEPDQEDEPDDVDGPRSLEARDIVGILASNQYWRATWRDNHLPSPVVGFDLGNPATLGPTISYFLSNSNPSSLEASGKQTYITEHDAVREVLFILQGNKSCLVHEVSLDGFNPQLQIVPNCPRLRHFSVTMYHSILLSFIKRATVLRFLRAFVTSVYDNVSHNLPKECMPNQPAEYSRHSVLGYVPISKISIHGALPKNSPFVVLARAACLISSTTCFIPYTPVDLLHVVAREVSSSFDFTSKAPSIISMTLLDALLSSVQLARSAYGDHQAAKTLMYIFTRSVEPLWASIGIWLKLGMSLNDSIAQDDVLSNAVGPDAEFFLRRRDVQLGSADFWLKGYTVRLHRYSGVFVEEVDDTEDTSNGSDIGVHTVPEFLQLVASDILAAGKSVGLLRALQVDDFFGDSTNDEYEWMQDWPSFRSLIGSDSLIVSASTNLNSSDPPPPNQPILEAVSPPSKESSNLESPSASDDGDEGPWASAPSVPFDAPSHRPLHSSDNPLLSADALASLIQERVKPWCRLANSRLHRVLVVDCELWRHLGCMEDLFFTRRGDALTHFCDVLFDRIDQKRAWSDYHSLNSLFRDVAVSTPGRWIDPSLVRFSYRGLRARNYTSSVRILDGLSVEYQVPFPLTYLFGPAENQVYSSVFIVLLQLRRAKSAVESILIRGALDSAISPPSTNLKAFHSLRSRFTWLINTLTHHFMTNVIHTEILRLHEVLKSTSSLDEMITAHNLHLSRLQTLCFLGPNTTSPRKAVLSVLDLCLHFTAVYKAYSGGSGTVDVTHRAIRFTGSRRSLRRGRLNRQQRLRRKNLIGFTSDALPASSDEEEEDDEHEGEILESSPEGDEATSTHEAVSMGDMTLQSTISLSFADMDFGSVLASDGTEEAATFARLAFSLDDWDL